jgi:hypothetical protein
MSVERQITFRCGYVGSPERFAAWLRDLTKALDKEGGRIYYAGRRFRFFGPPCWRICISGGKRIVAVEIAQVYNFKQLRLF